MEVKNSEAVSLLSEGVGGYRALSGNQQQAFLVPDRGVPPCSLTKAVLVFAPLNCTHCSNHCTFRCVDQ